ncbi:MAG: carboxypeptidase M32 [Chlamydiia bacterium]|nr:carboxypeptidase M32 [Chlamydiia bacterium]
MSKGLEAYKKLQRLGKEIRLLSSIGMLLEWDQETYMPKEGREIRAEQIELLSSIAHQKKVEGSYKKALRQLIDLESGKLLAPALDNRKKAALEEMRREYLLDKKLPNDFVKKVAKASSQGVFAWQKAKQENAFETFLPHLETIISLHIEKAELLGYEAHPYDALVNQYETGMTVKTLDALFGELKPFLVELTLKAQEKPAPSKAFLSASIPLDQQASFTHALLKRIGVSSSRARIDYSSHPFCLGLHPTDVRLTTHTSSTSFLKSLSGVTHEAGHALYELGLPPEDYGTPLGEYCSLGIHESQSRFWECFIGHGAPFISHLHEELLRSFPKTFESVSSDVLYSAFNHVEPSLIRVFADEVTYILHIILRYEIEKGLITKEITPASLPKIWGEKMEELFGIVPMTDREGCLQDIHWLSGLIGYFPTYALGNLYAGQLYQTFTATFPNYDRKIASGDLHFIKEFLHDKIHRYGREFSALTLIEKATGAPLSSTPYMNYLSSKHQ